MLGAFRSAYTKAKPRTSAIRRIAARSLPHFHSFADCTPAARIMTDVPSRDEVTKSTKRGFYRLSKERGLPQTSTHSRGEFFHFRGKSQFKEKYDDVCKSQDSQGSSIAGTGAALL